MAYRADRGFSLVELIVVVAVVGILMVIGMPNFISYYRNSTLKAGAQELISILNAGRQVAIKENQPVCVRTEAPGATYGTRVRYIVRGANCNATQTCVANGNVAPCIWTGAGTDASGYIRLNNEAELLQTSPVPGSDVVFSYLGAGQIPGAFTVRIANRPGTATVTVQSSGRVQYTFP